MQLSVGTHRPGMCEALGSPACSKRGTPDKIKTQKQKKKSNLLRLRDGIQ